MMVYFKKKERNREDILVFRVLFLQLFSGFDNFQIKNWETRGLSLPRAELGAFPSVLGQQNMGRTWFNKNAIVFISMMKIKEELFPHVFFTLYLCFTSNFFTLFCIGEVFVHFFIWWNICLLSGVRDSLL